MTLSTLFCVGDSCVLKLFFNEVAKMIATYIANTPLPGTTVCMHAGKIEYPKSAKCKKRQIDKTKCTAFIFSAQVRSVTISLSVPVAYRHYSRIKARDKLCAQDFHVNRCVWGFLFLNLCIIIVCQWKRRAVTKNLECDSCEKGKNLSIVEPSGCKRENMNMEHKPE